MKQSLTSLSLPPITCNSLRQLQTAWINVMLKPPSTAGHTAMLRTDANSVVTAVSRGERMPYCLVILELFMANSDAFLVHFKFHIFYFFTALTFVFIMTVYLH